MGSMPYPVIRGKREQKHKELSVGAYYDAKGQKRQTASLDTYCVRRCEEEKHGNRSEVKYRERMKCQLIYSVCCEVVARKHEAVCGFPCLTNAVYAYVKWGECQATGTFFLSVLSLSGLSVIKEMVTYTYCTTYICGCRGALLHSNINFTA